MVTEILRPLDGSGCGGSCTLYPEGTSTSEIYTLINENVADDDATYIKVASAISLGESMCDILIGSKQLVNNYSNVTACRVYFRGKSDSVSNLFGFAINASTNDITKVTPTDTTWSEYYVDLNVDNLKSSMQSPKKEIGFYLRFGGIASNSDQKNFYVYLTQLYVEVTYSDVDEPDNPPATTETVYLKENGTWTSVSCTIYQKQAGAWTLTDSTVFNNGDNFILQQTT